MLHTHTLLLKEMGVKHQHCRTSCTILDITHLIPNTTNTKPNDFELFEYKSIYLDSRP